MRTLFVDLRQCDSGRKQSYRSTVRIILQFASPGSQLVHLKIKFPKGLTPWQVQFLRQFDDETACSGKGIARRSARIGVSKKIGSKDSSSKTKRTNMK
jgi:hypothetical protein